MAQKSEKYRGQWGGKTESGEEMWWSEFWPQLSRGGVMGRFRFWLDPRHNVLIHFFREALAVIRPEYSAVTSIGAPRIIDFGCGTGGGTLNFSKYLDITLDGYDIFPMQLEIAREQALQHGMVSKFRLIEANGQIPLADNTVDILFSSDVLGHVPDVPSTLKEWSRVLRSGGYLVLFTEASYSPKDRSIMAALYRQGIDMIGSIPEHISLLPREKLEELFLMSGFDVVRRYSANVLHFFFAPKDYIKALQPIMENAQRPSIWLKGLYYAARIIHFIHKIIPFYPQPLHALKLFLIYRFGRSAYGCNYYYLLRKR